MQAACELSGEYTFIPLVVDTFGNLSPDASSLLARLAKLHGQRNPTRGTVIAVYVWRRVAYAVQRGRCVLVELYWLQLDWMQLTVVRHCCSTHASCIFSFEIALFVL